MIGDMKGELGEVRGQLREVNHTLNNLSQKFDSMAVTAAKAQGIPNDIADLKARVAVLEAKENQRTGAVNLGAVLLKSPLLAWLFAGAVAAWVFLKGARG
ncbi:hypothetical protein [Rhizorhapis sp.]|uniref:hypothetical protein n=1 Tax=Rhizorhapis sp. TaxID=1968842 RepID=UPI002B46BA17|nr:hypothetical protein [Rhizorhapis sp.]HKR17666.1 hypothetical protein [Rhizorhapis sp.]